MGGSTFQLFFGFLVYSEQGRRMALEAGERGVCPSYPMLSGIRERRRAVLVMPLRTRFCQSHTYGGHGHLEVRGSHRLPGNNSAPTACALSPGRRAQPLTECFNIRLSVSSHMAAWLSSCCAVGCRLVTFLPKTRNPSLSPTAASLPDAQLPDRQAHCVVQAKGRLGPTLWGSCRARGWSPRPL